MKKNANFSCAFDKKCGINKVNRKHCQACRLDACLGAGDTCCALALIFDQKWFTDILSFNF